MRPAHLATILEREFAAADDGLHTPVMLWGPPGVGKSDLVRGVARRVEVGLIDLRLSQLEPTDLRGIPFRDGGRGEWSVPSTLPDALRAANAIGTGRELFTAMRRNALTAEEGACAWL